MLRAEQGVLLQPLLHTTGCRHTLASILLEITMLLFENWLARVVLKCTPEMSIKANDFPWVWLPVPALRIFTFNNIPCLMAHMAALSRNIFFLSKILLGFTQGLIQSLQQWLSAVQWEQPQPGYSLLAAAVPCSGSPFLCSLRNIDHNPKIVVSGQISKGYRITEIMNGSNRFTRGRLA